MPTSCVAATNFVFQTVTIQGHCCYSPFGLLAIGIKGITKLNRFDRSVNRQLHSKSPKDSLIPKSFTLHAIVLSTLLPGKSISFKCLPIFFCSKASHFTCKRKLLCLLKFTTSCFSKPQGHLWCRQPIIWPPLVHLHGIRPACQPYTPLASALECLGAKAQQAKYSFSSISGCLNFTSSTGHKSKCLWTMLRQIDWHDHMIGFHLQLCEKK